MRRKVTSVLAHPPEASARQAAEALDDLARLRRENTDLRKQVRIYAEAIRQLTLDKEALEERLQSFERVTSLDEHRRQHQASADNGQIERPP